MMVPGPASTVRQGKQERKAGCYQRCFQHTRGCHAPPGFWQCSDRSDRTVYTHPSESRGEAETQLLKNSHAPTRMCR